MELDNLGCAAQLLVQPNNFAIFSVVVAGGMGDSKLRCNAFSIFVESILRTDFRVDHRCLLFTDLCFSLAS